MPARAAASMAASLVATLALALTPAQAAFPGTNGKIAFSAVRAGGVGSDVYVITPMGPPRSA